MVYTVQARVLEFRKTCGDTMDDLEAPLKWMREPKSPRAMTCGLAELAAWAHCYMMNQVRSVMATTCATTLSGAKVQELVRHFEDWKKTAKELSHVMTERENQRCN
mmetsp:Transcript_92592/g.215157  ORF Transcript_92592/g.215157 Transcript_92592/m.215157 type:complete len:106 (-) Transcript_92592:187-504(-)